MIEINKLRIGNLFQDDDNTFCYFAGAWERSDGWIIRDSGNNTYKPAQAYPIALTPEILEACGFEKDRNGWHMLGTQFSLTDQFYPCWLDRMLWPQDLPEFKSRSLKYLHQLQNLFFALTNTELEVNLNKEKV